MAILYFLSHCNFKFRLCTCFDSTLYQHVFLPNEETRIVNVMHVDKFDEYWLQILPDRSLVSSLFTISLIVVNVELNILTELYTER